jgi:hypothetical protein
MRSVSGLPPVVLDPAYEARLHEEAHGQRRSVLCAFCARLTDSPEPVAATATVAQGCPR